MISVKYLATQNYLKVNNADIEITAEKDPGVTGRRCCSECTCIFTDKEKASSIEINGSERLISPCKQC